MNNVSHSFMGDQAKERDPKVQVTGHTKSSSTADQHCGY